MVHLVQTSNLGEPGSYGLNKLAASFDTLTPVSERQLRISNMRRARLTRFAPTARACPGGAGMCATRKYHPRYGEGWSGRRRTPGRVADCVTSGGVSTCCTCSGATSKVCYHHCHPGTLWAYLGVLYLVGRVVVTPVVLVLHDVV